LSLSDKEMREHYLVYGEALKARQHLANTWDRKTEEDWFAPKVFLRATEFLEGASKRKPFFLVVDSYDPHEPWDPPEEYTTLYDDPYDGPEPFTSLYGADDYLTERQLRRMRALYAGEVTMMDRWLGRFLGRARDLGVMENTLLVLLSDHGHALGEHGYTGKPHYALWPELTDIAFLIRHPGGKGAGETSDYFASTHDVAPTILGFLGVEPEQPMDGQDLSVLFDGGKVVEPRPHFTLGYSEFVWVRDEGYAMFGRNNGTRARLYDLTNDPKMDEDVAAEHPAVVRRMFAEYILGDAGGPLPTY
jgi:arylsulfatase A-like enzyme